MERLQDLVNFVKNECPTVNSVGCFMDEDTAVLQVFFSDPGEVDSEPDESNNDDVNENPMDYGGKYMFLYHLSLNDTDWSIHKQKIVEKYNSLMKD